MEKLGMHETLEDKARRWK